MPGIATRQRDALHDRWVGRLGAGLELGDEPGQVGVGHGRHQVLGELNQRPERLPPGPSRVAAGGLGGQPLRTQHGVNVGDEVGAGSGRRGGAQRPQRGPDLDTLEEPLAASDLKRDTSRVERSRRARRRSMLGSRPW